MLLIRLNGEHQVGALSTFDIKEEREKLVAQKSKIRLAWPGPITDGPKTSNFKLKRTENKPSFMMECDTSHH